MIESTRRFAHWPWVIAGLITLLTVIVLHQMGRVWWCACGSWRPGSWTVASMHNSQHLLDPYTFSHLLHGVIFFLALAAIKPIPRTWLLPIAILIEAAWEIVENTPMIIDRYRAATASLGYSGDSIANSVADILACAAGFVLARRIGLWPSVALFVAIELALLWLIRDNLTLNVIMLLHPIQAIKTWQAGGAMGA
jgi:hypothetical protein